jgi:hypothetical protein
MKCRLRFNRWASKSAANSANQIDFSEIIYSMNYLTDSDDSSYNGINPSLPEMELQLDNINGETI